MWFNTWEANLIALGFGKKSDVDGHLEITDDQLVRMLNLMRRVVQPMEVAKLQEDGPKQYSTIQICPLSVERHQNQQRRQR
jgi:hypothetical protein